MQPTLVVRDSANDKTGHVSCTYRPQHTCPKECPLWASRVCYGMQYGMRGRPPLFAGLETRGSTDPDVVRSLAHKGKDVIRLNVVGDFVGPDGEPDLDYIAACNDIVRIRAEIGRPCVIIAYTHAWRSLRPDMFAFVVRASCDTLADVAIATSAGWSATLVIPEHDTDTIDSTIGTVRVVPCLNQVPAARQCVACKLCARDTAGRSVVAFRAHGAGRRRLAVLDKAQ